MLTVFPDPRAAVAAELNAAKSARWPTATISTSFPETAIAVPHIQHAWDGTPSQQANRQLCTVRLTCWAPRRITSPTTTTVSEAEAINLAQLVLAVLLDSGSASVWRFRPGAGPLPGVDPATDLPFCTFAVTAEIRPAAVV